MNLDLRIEEYLDGTLDPNEAKALEAQLANPEVAAAFSEAILIRTLLKSRVELPHGLVDQVADILITGAVKEEEAVERVGATRAIADGFSWAWKGPAQVLAPVPAVAAGAVRAGTRPLRIPLPPVDSARALPDGPSSGAGKRSWWRKAAGMVFRATPKSRGEKA